MRSHRLEETASILPSVVHRPDRRRYLVTGGAGFVGSHVARALVSRGDQVIVLDDLSQGHQAAVSQGAELVVTDLGDPAALDRVLSRGPWDGVLHFAARSLVGESMQDGCGYLVSNAASGIALIAGCVRHGVPRFVL